MKARQNFRKNGVLYPARMARDNIKALSARAIWNTLGSILPYKSRNIEAQYLFIIGCGRSGTTILGRLLEQHSNICYLNEPYYMWYAAFPEGDLWTQRSSTRNARVRLGDEAYEKKNAEMLRWMFMRKMNPDKHKILCEKSPINAFRIPLIEKVFQKPRYIFLNRDEEDVADSIRLAYERDGTWYGFDDYKWSALINYAKEENYALGALGGGNDVYKRGILEWRLTQHAVNKSLAELDSNRYLVVNYSELVEQPVVATRRLLDYIGIPIENQIERFAKDVIKEPRKRKMEGA